MTELSNEQLAAALKELTDQTVERFNDAIAKSEELKQLYNDRAAALGEEVDLSEIIAKNNEIANAEAKKAAALLRENQERRLRFAEEEAAVKREIASAEDDMVSSQRRQVELLTKQRELETKIREETFMRESVNEDLIKQLKEELKTTKDMHTQAGDSLRLATQRRIEGKVDLKQRIKRNGLDEQEFGNLVRNHEKRVEIRDANEGLQASTRGMLKTFLGVTDQSDSFAMNLLKSDDAFGQIGDTMKATLTGENVGMSLLNKLMESTLAFMMEFDKLAASFRKNTGIIDKGFTGIEQRIVNVQRANIRMGVSMDEAFASANALVSGMAQFTSMNDEAQNRVTQTTALLQEFGVSAQTTAEIFNTFSKGLGYDAQQLENLGTQIMGIATSLKVPPQIIATDFNAASKELMKYGGDMVRVFEGLAEQSKQTGIAMNELLGIAKQYDTFEGAGAAVGKLNAILGGPYLNAINMLYATEEDRIKMMRESISMSGRQFSDLSRFEQQAIASAAGISDMAQAAKLFGGTTSEFAKSRMEMKEMQERAAAAQSVQEKFLQVMQAFAIALGPVVNILGILAEALVVLLTPFNFLEEAGIKNASMLNNLVVAGIAFAAMAKASLIPSITTIGAAMSVALGPIAAFGVAFGAVLALKKYMGPFAKAALALAAAIAFFWAALAGPGAIGMAASFAVAAASIGTAAALAMPSYSEGKRPGEKVPGGRGLVAENGEEMVVTGDGQAYMVEEPAVVELGAQDTVLSNADTKAAMAGGSVAELAPVLQAIQSTLADLNSSLASANNAAAIPEKASEPVVINMDGRKVAESTIAYIKSSSNLSLSPRKP